MTAVRSGDSSELEKVLVGHRIWVDHPADPKNRIGPLVVGPFRVLSFRQFLPADPPGPQQGRKKHLVQIWTDPGGMRTLSVGSITFKDPGKVKAGHAAAATRAENELNPVDEDEDN